MNQKDYLIKILELIEPDWPMASGLKTLIETSNSEEIFSIVQSIIHDAITTTNNNLLQQKLETVRQELINREAQDTQATALDLARLEEQLANL